MIDSATLRAIIECDTDSLRTLANVARGDPASFFRGANFDDADLRGQDLRGFNLQGASFNRTRTDRNTKVDQQYAGIVGTGRRVSIDAYIDERLLSYISRSYPNFNKYHSSQILGDILEENYYSYKLYKKNSFNMQEMLSLGVLFDMNIPDEFLQSNFRITPSSENLKLSDFDFHKDIIHITSHSKVNFKVDGSNWKHLGRSPNRRRRISVPAHIFPKLKKLASKNGAPLSEISVSILCLYKDK